MSDLHRAVEAELDAHRPGLTPPFSTVRARKQRRDHRRAGGAVALSVAAVLGVVGASTTLGFGAQRSSNGQPSYAGPVGPSTAATQPSHSQVTENFVVEYRVPSGQVRPPDGVVLRGCLALPGVVAHEAGTVPPGYDAAVTGVDQTRAFTDCMAQVKDVTTTSIGVAQPADGGKAARR